MLEGVGPHNSLVGLDGHARVLLDHVARWCYMYWIYSSSEIRTATGRSFLSEVRRPFQRQSHHYFFEGRVARPFSNSVDRALDLARAVRRARDRVSRTEPEVVLAVRTEHDPVRFFT